jgi:hypothetical protein
MPAYDTFHEAVKSGLIKDGWTITHAPLRIEFGLLNIYIDLGAGRIIAAEREDQRIAVEIKSFVGASLLTDFHLALGQFLNDRNALRAKDPGRELYLPSLCRYSMNSSGMSWSRKPCKIFVSA